MSTTLIIALIIALAVLLLGYAFITQTMDRRRKQRQRLQAALKTWAKDFKLMLQGFPAGFLSDDLNIYLYKSLINALEQLAELAGTDSQLQELPLYREQLLALQNKPKNRARIRLDSPQQMTRVRALLQDLNSLLGQQLQKGNLNSQQHKFYENEIRNAALQVCVDECLLAAHRAANRGKNDLANHHFSVALQLLNKENNSGIYARQIGEITQLLAELQATLPVAEPASANAPKTNLVASTGAQQIARQQQYPGAADNKK